MTVVELANHCRDMMNDCEKYEETKKKVGKSNEAEYWRGAKDAYEFIYERLGELKRENTRGNSQDT